jgi:tRNA(Arg) A34 adenosine deaminase TadA
MQFPEYHLQLPDWISRFLSAAEYILPNLQDRMQLAIDLARHNIEKQTGGPFGAAVFEIPSGKLITPGVNQVETSNCSLAHAEMVALSLAQQKLGTYDLAQDPILSYELVTSTEPCAMCLGAIGWSGIKQVVCGARDEDARAIGFDEGAKPEDWIASLESRGIKVVCDVLRPQARGVFQQYQQMAGLIYNPGKKK